MTTGCRARSRCRRASATSTWARPSPAPTAVPDKCGHVPIHGRLFMQWMHMVYPRECAFPHMSGTTKQVAPEAWAEVTLKDATASLDEMSRFVNTPVFANQTEREHGQCGRWVDQEELFVGGHTS